MKIFTKILMIVAILVIIVSCNDIADLGNNTVKIPILTKISKEDSLNFLDLSTIDFGDVKWQRQDTMKVVLNNLSDYYPVIIYNINLKNNFEFNINPEHGFPIVIPPRQNNSDNRIIAVFKTQLITPGFYQDTVFLNGSQQKWCLIKGNVTN